MSSWKPASPLISRMQLAWDENGLPHSTQFNDKYFCQENGYSESLYVFCGGNDLEKRFKRLNPLVEDQFTIGETGFGTGLNFLSAWQIFDRTAPKQAKLHFISLDRFPLTPEDLEKALKLWPELKSYSAQLIQQYPRIIIQQPTVSFQNGRVTLTLILDDVVCALKRMHQERFQMDAWFLDGFDPAKNPDMWNGEVFQGIARLSYPGTTIATFTAAGFVRRGLAEAGFNMERAKGYGRKRHMLKGVFR